MIQNLIALYRRRLGIPDDYFNRIRTICNNNRTEYTQLESFLSGIQPMEHYNPGNIDTVINDLRIDVPVWFGNPNQPLVKVCVIGKEPRHTDSAFNIVRSNNRVFSAPFGAHRWNVETTIKYQGQLKYFRALAPWLNHQNVFLLLTDVVKNYAVVSENKYENDINARQQFTRMFRDNREFLIEEMGIMNPDLIITFGDKAYTAVMETLNDDMHNIVRKCRHPASNGGEALARHCLRDLLAHYHP